MICCDGCEEWFHPKCINMTKKQAEAIKVFVCTSCKGKQKNIGKGIFRKGETLAPLDREPDASPHPTP